MADLAKGTPRTTQQDRITRNRDQMFTRRDTEAPQRRYYADIRNAARGDGGADELRQALGMVQKGAEDFQTYAGNKFKVEEDRNSGKGTLDGMAGKQDDVLFQRSRAYRESLTLSRAQRDWTGSLPDMDRGLQELINSQTDPDPAKREAEVAAYIEKHNAGFALDPETGELKDFGSPTANRWLAEQMLAVRTNATTKANALIEEKMGEESVNNASETLRSQILSGQAVDWTKITDSVLPTVDKTKALPLLLTAAKSAIIELEETDPVRGKQLLNGLLGVAKASLPQPAVGKTPDGKPAPAGSASLVQPFSGFSASSVTGKIGDKRGGSAHNGEDFPVPVGTPIVSPMGGKVVSSFRNARGGHQVIVEFDNGDRVGFAHLSERQVTEGSRVTAGQQLGLSGNTGKSTGPHVHMTVTKGGQKVSPSEYFRSAPAATGGSVSGGPAVAPNVLDPSTPSEQADALGGVQLVAPPSSLMFTPAQRLDLQEFARNYSTRIDAKAIKRRTEDQDVAASQLLSRFDGLGAAPTITEVQEAVRSGKIRPEQGHSFIKMVESDAREARAEARAIRAEQSAAEVETKRNTVDTVSNRILGRVLRGEINLTQANGEVLKEAAGITDREVRQTIIREVNGELSSMVSLRQRGPEYARADGKMRQWTTTYSNALSQVKLPPRMTREQANALIKNKMDEAFVDLSRGDIPPAKVEEFLTRKEKDLDGWFKSTFPPRAAPPKR